MNMMLLLLVIEITVLEVGGSQKDSGIISRGTNTTIDVFPFIVSILIEDTKNSSGFALICSGTIIHPFKVLTAGSCVAKMKQHEIGSVLVRSNTETWNCDCHRTRSHTVAGYIQHENYDIDDRHEIVLQFNDIGIVTVYEEFRGTFARTLAYDGSKAFWINFQPQQDSNDTEIIGWGEVNSFRPNPVPAKQLIRANINIYDPKLCYKLYKSPSTENRTLYCAIVAVPGLTGPCRADEGGPNLGKVNGVWILLGVISSPTGCYFGASNRLYPSTFTNVSKFFDWIYNNIKSDYDSNFW